MKFISYLKITVKVIIFVLVFGLVFPVSPAYAGETYFKSMVFPNRYPATVLDKDEKIEEPSGIVYHPFRKTLFVVGDDGVIAEMDVNCNVINKRDISRGNFEPDLEGITVDTRNGNLFAVEEHDNCVYQIDPDTLQVIRIFSVEERRGKLKFFEPGGNGFEGIAFVPKPGGGGSLYIGNQDDPPRILVADLPDMEKEKIPSELKITAYLDLPFSDIADLCYHPIFKTIFIVSDWNNTLFEMTPEGRIVNQFSIPGKDQEGIAFLGDSVMYIAQDSGKILKIIYDPDLRHKYLPVKIKKLK